MKGRDRNKGAPPAAADLLVCFPTRSHLRLMPKPTCSPSRRFLQHQLKKSSAATSSSMLLLKNKHMESDVSEPTSPKVTCSGQIKVRPKTGCKNWQSVMEEIEKLHHHKKTNKINKPNWAEALGFKKDVMHFLTCLRTIRFDFRCFGSFPSVDISSSDDEDEEEEEDDDKDNAGDDKYQQHQEEDDDNNSKAVFSKWFMVLQEENHDTKQGLTPNFDDEDHHQSANVPPPNALLLMRCRSAPAKSWLEEREEDKAKEEEKEEVEEEKKAKMVNEEEVKRKKILEENNLVVMKYDTDFYKLSCDIAKETWVVGGMNKDQMSRSRSCKR
ncbi:hypothetical protein DCAR_0418397 [Daucus carota subsp. sativus]|uniref:ARID domain-containing protein n=1 Tax=Daucus carota subsp. sativus TaxID=79200 RepID=A0AAF0WZM3_DAUCS|nr:PREDICTED: uncharacterized protein LOC108216671 [Daucus carota subsp. sativus]WOG99050.1 hypothetical protein DCAR_0418397 [Daucus carota subsp. sativus]